MRREYVAKRTIRALTRKGLRTGSAPPPCVWYGLRGCDHGEAARRQHLREASSPGHRAPTLSSPASASARDPEPL